MSKKLYNTYSIPEENITLFELDRTEVEGKEYLMLLQKEEPNVIVAGFFEDGKLQLIDNVQENEKILKHFVKDTNDLFEKLKPFIKF